MVIHMVYLYHIPKNPLKPSNSCSVGNLSCSKPPVKWINSTYPMCNWDELTYLGSVMSQACGGQSVTATSTRPSSGAT